MKGAVQILLCSALTKLSRWQVATSSRSEIFTQSLSIICQFLTGRYFLGQHKNSIELNSSNKKIKMLIFV